MIINIDGKQVRTGADLTEAGSHRPENHWMWWSTETDETEIQLRAKKQAGHHEMLTREEEIYALMARLSELSSSEKRNLGLRYGVKVDEILGGRFEKAGIPEGFIIVKLNNVYINDVAEFEKLIQQLIRVTVP